MRILYTGRQVELAPAQLRKVEQRFAKIGKLLDGRDEREAHVVLAQERHLHNAEITVNYHDHQLVGAGVDADLFTALNAAIEKLEKRALKVREKWRDTKRQPRKEAVAEVAAVPEMEAVPESETEGRIFRVDHHEKRKPMTVEEAVLEMERSKTLHYLVYRDSGTDRIAVLLRRRDGNFDLVEA